VKRYDLPVAGMHCAGCAQKIENALNELPGVRNSGASFLEERVWVEGEVALKEVLDVVEGLGYKVAVREVPLYLPLTLPKEKHEELFEKLGTLPGVLEVTRSQDPRHLKVRYIPGMITPFGIRERLMELGVQASIPEDHLKNRILDKLDREKDHTLSLLRVAVTAPIALLFLLHMVFDLPPFSLLHDPWTQAILATISVLISWNIHRSGLLSLIRLQPEMNTLVSIGSLTAYLYGVFQLLFNRGGEYTFDACAEILGIVLVGRYLEERARRKTSSFLKSLGEQMPVKAHLLREGKELEVPVEILKAGDEVIVSPGERVPADGIVISGRSHVDRSFLTGESLPVPLREGDEALAGEINQEGRITIRVTRVGTETIFSQLFRLLQEAQSTKAPIQRTADRISAIFVPAVILVSLVTFLYWGFFAPSSKLEDALIRAITVLIISCPCALGLATPAAVVVAMGVSARMKVLFKKAETLEILGRVKVLALDKTGTLTRGVLKLSGIYPAPGVKEDQLLTCAIQAELGSNHPVARSLLEFARRNDLSPSPPYETRNLPGEGVMARVAEGWIYAGSPSFIAERLGVHLVVPEGKGGIFVAVALNDRFLGYLRFSDEIKPEAYEFVEGLKRLGITPVLMSGDRVESVKEVADKLGIPRYAAELKPREKLLQLKELKEQYGRVGMVGDGINDAPALRSADVGIALMSGSDLTREAGDVVVLENDLLVILRAVELSRATLRIIYQNLAMSFFYNIVAIPVAAGVLSPFAILLKPWMGAVGMALSDLAVIGNSLRLRNFPLSPSTEVKQATSSAS